MIAFAPEALRQIDALVRHYDRLERPEAIRNLAAALDQAQVRITRDPRAGLPAPRPYSGLAREGRAWIKAVRYWIAYNLTVPLVIVAVFHESADIPNRI